MEDQRSGDIGRGENGHGRTARLQRHAHSARVQCRRHGQQGAVAFVRTRAVLLYLALIHFRLSENSVLLFRRGRRCGRRFLRITRPSHRHAGQRGHHYKAKYAQSVHNSSFAMRRRLQGMQAATRPGFPFGRDARRKAASSEFRPGGGSRTFRVRAGSPAMFRGFPGKRLSGLFA